MAIKKGWNGAILIGANEIGHMNSWSISWSADALEKTAYGDKDRAYDPGMRSAVVDFAGYYESSNTAQAALVNNFRSSVTNTAATVVCLAHRTTGAKSGWTGAGPITALSVGGAVDGLVPFSGSIQVSGGLSTYAT
jgi:hypothetical protein